MERSIITINKSGNVNIPSGNVWMSEMELVGLFGVIAPTLQAAIKAIYKSGTLCSVNTQLLGVAKSHRWVFTEQSVPLLYIAFMAAWSGHCTGISVEDL